MYAQLDGDVTTVERAVELLTSASASEVAAEITPLLEDQVAEVWDRGWQPADVLRLVDRDLGKLERVLVRRVLAAQAKGYEQL
ncbi:MAG TPA: aromatic acid decarboxylase, partial [Acidimicrobiia bacterium]